MLEGALSLDFNAGHATELCIQEYVKLRGVFHVEFPVPISLILPVTKSHTKPFHCLCAASHRQYSGFGCSPLYYLTPLMWLHTELSIEHLQRLYLLLMPLGRVGCFPVFNCFNYGIHCLQIPLDFYLCLTLFHPSCPNTFLLCSSGSTCFDLCKRNLNNFICYKELQIMQCRKSLRMLVKSDFEDKEKVTLGIEPPHRASSVTPEQ